MPRSACAGSWWRVQLSARAELELVRSFVSATSNVVCRLTAGLEVMEQRVRMREPGVLQGEHVARVATLNAILDHARLEDFTVANESRSLNVERSCA
jgi:hypothetical protein